MPRGLKKEVGVGNPFVYLQRVSLPYVNSGYIGTPAYAMTGYVVGGSAWSASGQVERADGSLSEPITNS